MEKGRLYEFACHVKAEDLENRLVSVAISDTKDWQRIYAQRNKCPTGTERRGAASARRPEREGVPL